MSFTRGVAKILSKLDPFSSKAPNMQPTLFTKGYHLPANPVIVLLGPFNYQAIQYIQTVYPQNNILQPQDNEAALEMDIKSLAETISLDFAQDANFLVDFPTNPDQCLELEKYINGINLAIHFKTQQQLSPQHQLMADWFSQRGMLMQFDLEQQKDKKEAQSLQDFETQLMANIKI